MMSGYSTVKINLALSPADFVRLKCEYALVIFSDVKPSSSQYKSIFRDTRRRFTFQQSKELLLIYCYGKK